VFGENVPGVAAIHHSLRHVKASAREIGPFVYIVSAEEIETVSSAIEFWLKTGVRQFLAKIAVTEP
jgi:hypothetical protein